MTVFCPLVSLLHVLLFPSFLSFKHRERYRAFTGVAEDWDCLGYGTVIGWSSSWCLEGLCCLHLQVRAVLLDLIPGLKVPWLKCWELMNSNTVSDQKTWVFISTELQISQLRRMFNNWVSPDHKKEWEVVTPLNIAYLSRCSSSFSPQSLSTLMYLSNLCIV